MMASEGTGRKSVKSIDAIEIKQFWGCYPWENYILVCNRTTNKHK